MEIEKCAATLEHAHGKSTCVHEPDHDGKHEGHCWTCYEDGDFDVLTWEHEHENWRTW